MLSFIKLFFTVSFINIVYSAVCIPQNINMTMPYYDQQISIEYTPSNVVQENNLINLYFKDQIGGTRVILDNKIQYGQIDAIFKTSVGNSIVSAFQLFSENTLDEIDFEFVQNTQLRNQKIQTTFYYKGIPLYNVNDLYIHTGIDLAYTYNKYTYVWNENYYIWKFNDQIIRRVYKNDTDTYPDSLSNIKFSIWQHEPSEWSGPQTNLAEGPFILSISSIIVSCPFGTSSFPITYNQPTMTTNMPSIAYNITSAIITTTPSTQSTLSTPSTPSTQSTQSTPSTQSTQSTQSTLSTPSTPSVTTSILSNNTSNKPLIPTTNKDIMNNSSKLKNLSYFITIFFIFLL
jgi:beta-glucanase (GH16 family)